MITVVIIIIIIWFNDIVEDMILDLLLNRT